MKTRQDYLNSNCTHQEYYAQFVTQSILVGVKRSIGHSKIFNAFQTDKHLNNIELVRWDSLIYLTKNSDTINLLHEAGDYLTMAVNVCILKEAARQTIIK